MHMPLCSRCKKNVAVVFITKIEGGETKNEGLCLKCASELGIAPVNDLMQKMGISEDDLDQITQEMLSANQDAGEEELVPAEDSNEDDEEDRSANTATFPFLNKIFGGPPAQPGPEREKRAEEEERPGDKKKKKKKFLDNYAQNLTDRARQGKLDRIVGRERETERVIQILNRRQKNNPCLIGEPGVGKTAVAEGLAQKIAAGDVPDKLKSKEVWLLDLTALVAGTQFRGQFESRMKGLIDEVKKLGNIILVIDEVHNLVGAGDAEGSMNAANILKPALSRGEIQVIGATTFAEYRKNIEKDAALERRFQPVTIAEPSMDDTFEILKGIRHYYEEFHGVTLPDRTLKLAVSLAERYITDRFLPDKAIDLIDEACSDVNLKNKTLSELSTVSGELADAIAEREALVDRADARESDYARIAELKSREMQLTDRMNALKAVPPPDVTEEDLARVIELWTKIPASRVCEQEFARLNDMAARLKKRVIGQDEAIEAVCAAIRRNRAGISAKRKPVSFIFVGPTGVGKTELVKCLAADMFDTPEALIRLDMSEFMEKHSVSKLIGAPPGYVGYDEAGQLTEKIRRRPYCVVLFDEIEKAHPEVLNIMLQILDDGRITDAHGRNVSFENTIIIMTSNAGSDRRDGSVGFGRTITEQGRDKAMKALSEIMRPEFINRIDEVISFNQLSKDDFAKITAIMLSDLTGALAERGITLRYDEGVVRYLVEKSYSVKFGARNLRRLIQKEIEDGAASVIISRYEHPVTALSLTSDGEKIDISAL